MSLQIIKPKKFIDPITRSFGRKQLKERVLTIG
jgi:hypothetical protein